jgi:hypothetical protein
MMQNYGRQKLEEGKDTDPGGKKKILIFEEEEG